MEKDPVLEKYNNEGFGKNAFGWYFNPWIDEYDPEYDPHNDKEYNEKLNEDKKEIKWHPKLTDEQIEELIAENIYPGDNEYDMYLWNHGINPFEKETKKTEPVKPEPVKPEPKKPEPKRPEPVKPEPVKPESKRPEPKRPEPVKPESIKSPVIQYEIESISISPYKRRNEISFGNGSKVVGQTDSKYENKNERVDKILEKVKETLGDSYNLDKNYKKLDPNILIILYESQNEEALYKYIKAICGKREEELPFDIEYDLKGISNLDREERENIEIITKRAKKLGATVKREGFLDIIKSKLEAGKRLLLPAPSKYKKRKITKKVKVEKYIPRHEKPKAKITDIIKEKLPDPGKHERHTSVISKAKSIASSLGRETVGGLKIIGTRVSGYLSGERELVKENRARSIREKYFFGDVDHKEAEQKANEPKEQFEIDKDPIK